MCRLSLDPGCHRIRMTLIFGKREEGAYLVNYSKIKMNDNFGLMLRRLPAAEQVIEHKDKDGLSAPSMQKKGKLSTN